MTYEGYECIRVRSAHGVAVVTIDHPPINLFDLALMQGMDRVGRELAADDAVRVVVLESADRDFFVAHADVTLIQRLPRDVVDRPTTTAAAERRMRWFLARGGQTPEIERDLGSMISTYEE